jgi:hypothetical protein
VSSFAAVANTPVKVVLPVAAVPLDAVIPSTSAAGYQIMIGTINTGTYQTSSLNGWQSGLLMTATGATNWGTTAGNFIEVTDLQIELGTQATEFERLDITDQINQCRRYYYTTAVNWVGYQLTGNGYGAMLQHPVVMRASPSVVATGVSTINTNGGGVGANNLNYWHTGSAAANGVVQYAANITLDAEF